MNGNLSPQENFEWTSGPLTPDEARAALQSNQDPNALVMCRGYGDDDENFTELVWDDDFELDFRDSISYPEFQLWIRRKAIGTP